LNRKKSLLLHKKLKVPIFYASESETVLCGAVSMGNPHCVVTVDSVVEAHVETLGQELSIHERFPEDANVGFMEIVSPNYIKLRVYERGAAETLACGSGACAAVVVAICRKS